MNNNNNNSNTTIITIHDNSSSSKDNNNNNNKAYISYSLCNTSRLWASRVMAHLAHISRMTRRRENMLGVNMVLAEFV